MKTDLIWAGGRPGERQRAPRHARDQDPRASQRQRQEAVAPEGHRPGARRRDPQPAVAQGRHRVRAAAAQLQLRPAEEGPARRAARGAGREAGDGTLIVVDALSRRRPQDQGDRGDADASRRDRQDAGHRRQAGRRLRAERRATSPAWRWFRASASPPRDIIDTAHVIVTRAALEKLQESAGIACSAAGFQLPAEGRLEHGELRLEDWELAGNWKLT